MKLPCPSCKNTLLIESVGSELSTEVSCDRCQATIGVTVATTLLAAGNSVKGSASNAIGDHSVVVAIADDDLRSGYAHALRAAGWQVRECKKGRETLQVMARDVPDVAVIDGGFSPIFGMGVGEIIKKSSVTRKVRLLGLRAGNNNLTPIPGAERTISLTAGPNQMLAEVTKMLPHGGPTMATPRAQTSFVSRPLVPKATPVEASAEMVADTTASTPLEAPEATADVALEDTPEHQAAQRLARIIVSDVVMYNQSLLDSAARSGTMAQAIEPLMVEGAEHYTSRIAESVRADTTYLEDALAKYVAKHEERMQAATV